MINKYFKCVYSDVKMIDDNAKLIITTIFNLDGTGHIIIEGKDLKDNVKIFIKQINISAFYEKMQDGSSISERTNYSITNFTHKSKENLNNLIRKNKIITIKINLPKGVDFSELDDETFVKKNFEIILYVSLEKNRKTETKVIVSEIKKENNPAN